MWWQNKVLVVDDILPTDQQESLKSILLEEQFPWNFIPDVTGSDSAEVRPAFHQKLVHENEVQAAGELWEIVQQLTTNSLKALHGEVDVEYEYGVFKIRAFLQLPLAGIGGLIDNHHIDHMPERHLSMAYYVCDADGDTLIYDNMYHPDTPQHPEPEEVVLKQRVTPKQGRVVIFDGYHWHTAIQPEKGVRCVISTNLVPLI